MALEISLVINNKPLITYNLQTFLDTLANPYDDEER